MRPVARQIGVVPGLLSQIERGYLLPDSDVVERMRVVYGDPAGWYPKTLARALADDLRRCVDCGEELDPGDAKQRTHCTRCRP